MDACAFVASVKRSIANGESGDVDRPCVISSAMISPTSGPSWKPCPEKPNACTRFGVVCEKPITGMWSGIAPSMPAQVRMTRRPASAGTRAIALAIAASDGADAGAIDEKAALDLDAVGAGAETVAASGRLDRRGVLAYVGAAAAREARERRADETRIGLSVLGTKRGADDVRTEPWRARSKRL